MPVEFRELPKESREGDSHTANFEGHVLDVYQLITLTDKEKLPIEELNISLFEKYKDDYGWKDRNGNLL